MNFNRVILGGHLTRDPELRNTQNGGCICNFGVAVSRKWKDHSSGEMKEETAFVDLTAFGKTAENIGKHFSKGKPILVEGRLTLDQWQDKATGEKRSKLKVVAEQFHFVGGKTDGPAKPAAATAFDITDDGLQF